MENGDRQIENQLGIALLQVMPVHPMKFDGIKDRRAARNLLQVESLDQFCKAEDLPVPSTRRPPQQRHVVGQRFGKNSPFPEVRQRGDAVPFAEPRVVGSQDG